MVMRMLLMLERMIVTTYNILCHACRIQTGELAIWDGTDDEDISHLCIQMMQYNEKGTKKILWRSRDDSTLRWSGCLHGVNKH